MPSRTSIVVLASLLSTLGCSAETGEPIGEDVELFHRFPTFEVASGEEISDQCQSWSLGNQEPMYVTRVAMRNEGAFHHSNWFFVPPTVFPGADGTWNCADRVYDEASAGFLGGVFFGQSTQALAEVQAFVPGAALQIPARSVIVGGVHLLNTTPMPVTTALEFDLETAPAEEITTVLTAMSFTNEHLDILPRAETRQRMACDFGEQHENALGRAPDFNIYYVLPHYHALGNYFRLELVGGDRDGEVVYEVDNPIGDSLGITLDPPLNVAGATGVRMVCGYDNPTEDTVEYGIGDQEMCVFLAYTDSPLRYGARSLAAADAGDAEGMPTHDAECQLFAAARID